MDYNSPIWKLFREKVPLNVRLAISSPVIVLLFVMMLIDNIVRSLRWALRDTVDDFSNLWRENWR